MKDQYAGDISDYLKFAFLRAIQPVGRTLGVAWYYTDGHDGRPDGRHLEYLSEPAWSALDPALYGELGRLPMRSIASLERLNIWPERVLYHGARVPRARDRAEWLDGMLASLAGADIIFADPDNGLTRAGCPPVRKSATLDEICGLAADRRPVVLIRFPHRLYGHEVQLQEHHEALANYAPWTVRTCVTVRSATGGGTSPRIRWFTVLNGDEALLRAAKDFAHRLELTAPHASIRWA